MLPVPLLLRNTSSFSISAVKCLVIKYNVRKVMLYSINVFGVLEESGDVGREQCG